MTDTPPGRSSRRDVESRTTRLVSSEVRGVESALYFAASRHGPLVLAVSGGLDSMTMLDGAARAIRGQVAAVASFDHGTGPHAARAAALVQERCARLGLDVVVGRAERSLDGEAAWREARWAFLRRVAGEAGARVATAHTRDDQLETVVMRALRAAGARGLAGLDADTGVVRPFLTLRRTELAAYARAHSLRWLDDPSNKSRRHLRNRLRLDLLPALRHARPQFECEMLELAEEAARWRRAVEATAGTIECTTEVDGALSVVRSSLEGYDAEALRVLWPALAARAGVTLDRRGTHRVAEFTTYGRSGATMQLSGGLEVVRLRDRFVLRRPNGQGGASEARPLAAGGRVGRWKFTLTESAGAGDRWSAELPADCRLTVRCWQPGDRMMRAGGTTRRVKRYLADAGVAGPDRVGWPVVLAGDEIIWVPGVRRSDAATVRSGRPVVRYACELSDG